MGECVVCLRRTCNLWRCLKNWDFSNKKLWLEAMACYFCCWMWGERNGSRKALLSKDELGLHHLRTYISSGSQRCWKSKEVCPGEKASQVAAQPWLGLWTDLIRASTSGQRSMSRVEVCVSWELSRITTEAGNASYHPAYVWRVTYLMGWLRCRTWEVHQNLGNILSVDIVQAWPEIQKEQTENINEC